MNCSQEAKKYFQFEVTHQDKQTKARAGILKTPHGEIKTPVFMPVGTHGAVKAQPPHMLLDLDIPIILNNTYHMHLSPGESLVKKAGGLHKFIGWPRSILTDSGGFQVFSLKHRTIDEEGVTFKGPKGDSIHLGPEKSIQIQQDLAPDIMMAFDECIPYPAKHTYAEKSIARTHRWLKRCYETWNQPTTALFGIIQGSVYEDLRAQCVQEVCQFDLPGYAIGGVSVGEGPDHMYNIVAYTAPLMPKNKPRYVMGVGNPEDLLMIWEQGIDMSDCIIPTKFARGGTVFTNRGKIRIGHRNYRRDFFPLDPNCHCYTCTHFSRAYVKHLFDSNEILGAILVTNHNIAFYHSLASRARESIIQGEFKQFKQNFLDNYLSD